ncbi:hypothetical protein TNCT_241861 [Trichonephila clavata]|uniref:Uncharacterized protein n=1 Tax=Trichonephila clavata TaxID=2740835 RepID=A0A8X6KEQ4_TRICU|nr:hypothetical protein TNCT_241861 [Trichonephila clavata]
MPVLAPTVPSSSNHREQVIWTRLCLGHTRLTHRHLLFGEPPPYCEICNVLLSGEYDYPEPEKWTDAELGVVDIDD